MPVSILTSAQEELLRRERKLLGGLQKLLARYQASRADQETLERSIHQLDELFLLVVVGEFNAGKSTFINALLGRRVLPEGVTPTTRRIHLLSHGEEEGRQLTDAGIERITSTHPLLQHVHIVDTPGTNALERHHEAITEEFTPRSDLVLFVTSADRPFTESERAFLARIRRWGKKLVFVINKADILRRPQDRAEVVDFVRQNARRLLEVEPEIFAVSARLALEAKLGELGETDGDAPEESGFGALEAFLVETLDETERLRLKLGNPLGVGLKLARDYLAAVGEREELLREDLEALEEIERQLRLYREDLGREFRFRLTDVDNTLHAFEQRGQAFFDETMRLPRIPDLLNKAKLKAEFESRVIADAPREIEKKVDEIIDWMVASELRQWRGVSERLEQRMARHADRLTGRLGAFDTDRRELLETVGRASRRAVEEYDRSAEAARMADSVQGAVASAALLEVGAIGLGATISLLATTQLADFTGILAAGTLAVLGLFVIPARRKKAKRELSERIATLRSKLMNALTEQFERESEKSARRIQEAIAPYSRFVRGEQEELTEMRRELGDAADGLRNLQAEIEEL